jgi:hypothetical protein
MIRRLIATATRFKAQFAKRMFTRKLVFRRENDFLHATLAYARIRMERPRGR